MQVVRNAFLIGLSHRNMAFYAVARGHTVGIYKNWGDCEKQIKGFKNARFKKFNSRPEAESFIKEFGGEDGNKFLASNSVADQTKAVTPSSKTDFWPESDGDSFEENLVTDEDLLNALYEVEGLPTTSKAVKRPAVSDNLNSSSSKLPRHSSQVLKVEGFTNVGKYEFPIDNEGFVIVYTDGSCINNGKKGACAGFGVYFSDDHPLNISKPVVGRVTNNVGEIQAAIYALQLARDLGIRKLCISTDSQFLINAATLWIRNWKRKNWSLANGDPVKNVADFKVLDLLLEDEKVTVKWNYVKGHANIRGNEMADKLAREGAAEYERLNKVTK